MKIEQMDPEQGARGVDWARRPAADEYEAYYRHYVAGVPEGDVLATLERRGAELVELLRAWPAQRERHAYAPGKWTAREVAGHVVDAERVFALRALWFARGAATPLPGFEENDWARVSNAGARAMADLAAELAAQRRATVLLFRGMDAAAAERRGVANGVGVSVRALAWIAAGHADHHRRMLEERYRV